jgi:hypothetical protein
MMITSGFAGLAAFLAALQLGAALWAVAVGVRSWLLRRADSVGDAVGRSEDSSYLAALLAYLLLGLSAASWTVLYLMLDSFVPQWPGAMCIYGLTQIGAGSSGVYGWLPSLVMLQQALKPTLFFATGAALVLYRFYRRQGTRDLLPRVVALLLIAAAVASIDAVVEIAYLAIPKRENLPNTGCCSVSAGGQASEGLIDEEAKQRWYAAYYGGQAALAALLMTRIRFGPVPVASGSREWEDGLPRPSSNERDGLGRPSSRIAWRFVALLGMAMLTLWVSVRFLIDVASPKLLHLPYHHCLYDLVPAVPEIGLALVFLLWGTFCVGWAAVVEWAAHRAAPAAEINLESRRWLAYAVLGYLGSMTLISLDLWLA